MQQIRDAAPADSGADASVRLAGRTARTRLKKSRIFVDDLKCHYDAEV